MNLSPIEVTSLDTALKLFLADEAYKDGLTTRSREALVYLSVRLDRASKRQRESKLKQENQQ